MFSWGMYVTSPGPTLETGLVKVGTIDAAVLYSSSNSDLASTAVITIPSSTCYSACPSQLQSSPIQKPRPSIAGLPGSAVCSR